MDQRVTFRDEQQLLSIFSNLRHQDKLASLLIDEDGLTRKEGKISGIEQGENIGKTKITVDGDEPFHLEQVIAVNGLFRDDYSEC